MGFIDPEVSSKIQPELMTNESILWAGRPNPSVIFHSDDWYLIPFSLLWGGFAIFWEAGVLGYWNGGFKDGTPSTFMALWGIPFILVGQYMIWGRFFYDGWIKRRTYYAVTNRRILAAQNALKYKTCWIYINAIPTLVREGSPTGTLWFGPKYPIMGGYGQKMRGTSRFAVRDIPIFADIDDLDSVYRMVLDLREKSPSTPASPFSSPD